MNHSKLREIALFYSLIFNSMQWFLCLLCSHVDTYATYMDFCFVSCGILFTLLTVFVHKMQVFVWNGWLFFRTMPHDEFTIVHSEFFINTQIERIVYTHNQFTNHSFLLHTCITIKKTIKCKKNRGRDRDRERKLQQFLYVSSAYIFFSSLLSVVFFSAILNGIRIECMCAYVCTCFYLFCVK